MFAVPALTPVTTPVAGSIAATDAASLVQVPPVVVLVNVVVAVAHTDVVPPIADGAAFTVTVAVASVPQPVE